MERSRFYNEVPMGIEDKLKDKILVPSHDHSYRLMNIGETEVVYNPETLEFSEYHGEDYLNEGEIVIKARTAQ